MITAISRTAARASLGLAGLFLALGAVPAQAGTAGVYSATLQTPVAAPRQEILDEALWKCAGDTCSARVSGSKPLFTCQRVVRKLGPVARFTIPGGELSAAEVAQCNKR